jgi:hypothetical protein
VVYIGFGSIVVSDPKKMTRCVIQAVVRSGVCAVLSKGWSDRLHVKTTEVAEVEEPLPPQIYPLSSIPHDWLFQRIDAACHHGGAGTTGASLRGVIGHLLVNRFSFLYFFKPVYRLSSILSLATNSFGLIESKPWESVLASENLLSRILLTRSSPQPPIQSKSIEQNSSVKGYARSILYSYIRLCVYPDGYNRKMASQLQKRQYTEI